MIRVGAKRPRGIKGVKNPVYDGYKNIDATSGSNNKLVSPITKEVAYAKELSPLKGNLKVEIDGILYENFENAWQCQKVYREFGHCEKKNGRWVVTKKFLKWRKKWAKVKKGHRHMPGARKLKPIGAYWDGEIISYKDSREYYINLYRKCVENLPSIRIMTEMLENGENIMILGGDGPPLKFIPKGNKMSKEELAEHWSTFQDAWPEGAEVTPEFLAERREDINYPYGHEYVVANILYDKLNY
ncbi:unnamed protein product [Blepharisma stoltei]|uniref:Uncharacterized protein n=1 Tax=Blepharisma stoltei TaxID=1481888 RepID=A0AAU9IZ22_9CILI|nr:unnamed protein product [Blepharisma stoltei]